MSAIAISPPSAALSVRTARRAAWLGFAVVVASAVMDLLDSTITQTTAPAIRRDLGGSYADLQWISAAYTLAMSVSLLLGSRLGDVLGRRRVLLFGIGGFVAASVLCALAPSATALIAARALQGVVAAAMVPQAFGLIRELFGDEGQQKALGVFGPAMGLAAVAGPLVGVYPLIDGREQGWPAWSLALLAAGLVTLALFARLQNRRVRQGRSPLVEPSVLRRRPYVAGLAVVLGFIGAMGGMMIAINVMYQLGFGFSPLACAVATIAIPLAAIGGSITSSMLLARIGRTTMHIGIVVMGTGLIVVDLILRSATGALSAWDLAAPLAVTGYGMGMVFVPMFDVILAGVAAHELGSAAGLLESVQQLAMSIGIAAVGTVLFAYVGRRHDVLAFLGAADHALLVAVAFLGGAFAAAFWLPKHARAAH